MMLGRDSSAGIATSYGLDELGIEPRDSAIFPTHPDWPCSSPSLLYSGYFLSSPGVKLPGRGFDNPPSSNAEVKERIKLYQYLLFGTSWSVLE